MTAESAPNPICVNHPATLEVFNFFIQDETGNVNVVAWDEIATENHEQITVGDCYLITMFRVKEANAAYRQTESACELTLTKVHPLRAVNSNEVYKWKIITR